MIKGKTFIPLVIILLTVLVLGCFSMVGLHCRAGSVPSIMAGKNNLGFVWVKCDRQLDWSDLPEDRP